MTKCKQCNGSGVVHEYDDYDRMSTFRCPACDGAGEIMTNYDRIMANMTIEQMALIYIETDYISEDGFTILVYYTPFSTGYWTEKQSAIDEIVEWLKKECDA
jgi:hypothetical protein